MAVVAIGVDVAKLWMTSFSDPLEDGLFSLLSTANNTVNGTTHSDVGIQQTTVIELVFRGSPAATIGILFLVVITLVCLVAVAVEVYSRPALGEDDTVEVYSQPALGEDDTGFVWRIEDQKPTAAPPSQTAPLGEQPAPKMTFQTSWMPIVERYQTIRHSSSPMPTQLQPRQASATPLLAPVLPATAASSRLEVTLEALASSLSAQPSLASQASLAEPVRASFSPFHPSSVLRELGSSASSMPALTDVQLEIRGSIRPFKQQQMIEVFEAGTRFNAVTRSALLRCYIAEQEGEGIIVEVPGYQATAFLDTTSDCVVPEGHPPVPKPRRVTVKWQEPDGMTDEPFAVAVEQLGYQYPGLVKLKRLNLDHSEGPEMLQVLQDRPGFLRVFDPNGKNVAQLKPDTRSDQLAVPNPDSWSLLSVSKLYSSELTLVFCAVLAACKMQ